jgi:hypothetical protein
MQKKLELSSSLIMGHVEDNGQEQNDVKTCQNYRDTMAKFCLSLSDDKINQTLQHLKTLLHWYSHNFTTEFHHIILWCNFCFLHLIFQKNYARDTRVI